MRVAPIANLVCPLDGLALGGDGGTRRCASGHSYDRAREGYWNLLVAQHKASRDPGDTAEMVQARKRVLDSGLFAPLTDGLAEVVLSLAAEAPSRETCRVVDAGCGEGYHLQRLAGLAAQSGQPGLLELAGADVSKWAVKAAARRTAPVTWVVANNRRLPFAAGSIDIILCVFGFPVWDGFRLALRRGGRVVMVDPGPDHLVELREVIYPEVRRTPPASLDRAVAAGFEEDTDRRREIGFRLSLASRSQIQDLLGMTPHAHRMPVEGREAVERLDHLDAGGDVVIRVLRQGPMAI